MPKRAAVLALFLFSSWLITAGSTSLIRTRWFDVLYPPESAETAALVASRADGYAEEICALLGTTVKKRMPVYIESGISVLNAHYSPYPYDHIVLYDTLPTEGDLANNTDSVLAVFYHELTHALSLTIRTPFWQFVSSLFGDFISVNSALTMPLSFIEGVTVSFESRGGEGRLTDPAALHLLAQDKLEGRFLSWKEAAGAQDVYPGGRSHYLYGGFFARWLQTSYGMDRYASFWQLGAEFNLFSSNTQTRFRQTYGLSLDEAWTRFEESIPLPPGLRENERILPDTEEGIHSLLDSRGGRAIWLDLEAQAVMLRDRDGTVRRLTETDGTCNRLALSADGSELIISRAVRAGAAIGDLAEIYDIDAQRYTGERYPGLRDAAFLDAADRLIAVRSRAQRQSLVLVRRNNTSDEKELLAAGPGEAQTLLLTPVDSGTGRIACISAAGPSRAIVFVDPEDGSVSAPPLPERLRYIRYLARGDRRGEPVLTFGWTGADTFYRAALWNPSSMALELQYSDFSGGVYYPVWEDRTESVVYAAFLSGRTRLQTLTSANFAATALDGGSATPAGPDLNADAGKEPRRTPIEASGGGFAVYPYSPLPWLMDGVLLPIPKQAPGKVSRATGNILPGFLYVTGSPTERSAYQIQSAFAVDPFFADFTLDATWITAPGTVTAGLSDRLQPLGPAGDAYRDLSASMGYTVVTRFTPNWNRLTTSLRLINHWYGRPSDLDGALYGEPFASASLGTEGTLEWQAIRGSLISQFPLFAVTASGPRLGMNGWSGFQLPEGVSTRIIQARALYLTPVIPFAIEGAAAASYGLFFGSSSTRTDAESARDFEAGVTRYVASFPEYSETDLNQKGSGSAASVNLEFIPLTLEIQKGVPLFPVYANRIVLAGGYRGGWFGAEGGRYRYIDSGYGRMSIQGALLVGALSSVVLSIDFHYAQAIRRSGFDRGITFLSSFSL